MPVVAQLRGSRACQKSGPCDPTVPVLPFYPPGKLSWEKNGKLPPAGYTGSHLGPSPMAGLGPVTAPEVVAEEEMGHGRVRRAWSWYHDPPKRG